MFDRRFLVTLTTLVGLGGSCAQDGSSAPSDGTLGPARLPQWSQVGGHQRLHFSRSVDDETGNSLVDHYEVCVGSTCHATMTNFVDLDFSPDGATIVAVSLDGDRSQAVRAPAPSSDPLASEDHFAVMTGALTPSSVPSPFFGDFVIHSSSASSNVTTGPFSFWQHKSGYHKAGGGVAGADDTYAWDENLNLAGTAGSDMDKGLYFYAMGTGKVVKYGGTVSTGTNSVKSILIEHSGWLSGYLHASVVYVKDGDYVTPATILGKVGGSTGYPNHLHAVCYTGTNKASGLKSFNVTFSKNPLTVSLTGVTSLAKGKSATVTATGYRTHSAVSGSWAALPLNGSNVYDNTWWKSSNSTVLSVDGYGKVTAKAAGSATITFYYSGVKATRTISVY